MDYYFLHSETATITGSQFGSGPDLVILHSLLTDKRAFDSVKDTLAAKWRVTLLNLPGYHGCSTVEAGLSNYVAWIELALERFQVTREFDLLGNGFGGTLALGYAISYPDRIRRLVASDAAAVFPESGREAFRNMRALVENRGMAELADIASNRVLSPKFREANPEAYLAIADMIAGLDPVAFVAATTLLENIDLRPGLSMLDVPTLVICGDSDQATPPELNVMVAEELPNARYLELKDCGHCPPIEKPTRFVNALCTFLEA